MKTKLFTVLLLISVVFTSCDIQDIPIDENLPVATGNILVLSEGGFGQNNSTLAHYNLTSQTADLDYFQTQNSRGLGDLANDMIKYGSKIYIVVNGSSQIEVIDANTGVSLKRIPMFNGATAKQPRYIASYKNKVYVSSFDNTVTRIDTTSLAIDGSVTVGRNPEQLCIENGKLYVTNSGGLDFPNCDNTVSVIDLTTFTETGKITVGLNPTKIKAGENGYVYVATNGDYATDFGHFQRIDTKTNTVKTYDNVTASNFAVLDNKIYFYSYSNTVGVFDCTTEEVLLADFITDISALNTPTTNITTYIYSIDIDSYNGDVYLTTTDYMSNGSVYCFDKTGQFKFKISNVGLNPNKVAFLE